MALAQEPVPGNERCGAMAMLRSQNIDPVEVLARIGYAARGLVYTIVGWLAVLAALGRATVTTLTMTLSSCLAGA